MIKELKDFINFAEFGVDALDITIDQFISQTYSIEVEVKRKLIKYTSKRDISLTNFGKSFVSYAKKSIQALEESVNIANANNIYDADNQLTLGISRDSSSTWAINCIRNFNKMHPGLRLSIIADDAISGRMVDNATIIFWCIGDDELPNFDKLWYIEYKYGLFASDEYIKQFGEPTLDTLNHHKIIGYSGYDNNTSITNWHLRGEYGLPLIEPSILSQSRDLIAKMTADGLGIGAVCDRQDIYYGYKPLKRVIKSVDGPVLRSYFVAKKSENEQMRCNVELLSRLFQKYFQERQVEIKFI